MGRTIPSWRIVVEEELARMARFKQFLRVEDRVVFDDLLAQCRRYAFAAGVLASPVREVPLLLSMIFAQHRKLAELEKRMKETRESTWDAGSGCPSRLHRKGSIMEAYRPTADLPSD